MSDPVTPEEYGLRAAKRQLKKDNASLVEQNLALRSKVSVLAAQLEEARGRIATADRYLAEAEDEASHGKTANAAYIDAKVVAARDALTALDSTQTHGGSDE